MKKAICLIFTVISLAGLCGCTKGSAPNVKINLNLDGTAVCDGLQFKLQSEKGEEGCKIYTKYKDMPRTTYEFYSDKILVSFCSLKYIADTKMHGRTPIPVIINKLLCLLKAPDKLTWKKGDDGKYRFSASVQNTKISGEIEKNGQIDKIEIPSIDFKYNIDT